MREDERRVDAVDEGEGEGDGRAAVHVPGEEQAAGEVRHGLGGGTEQGDVFGEVRHPTGREQEQEPARPAREGGEDRAHGRGEATARHAPRPQVGEQDGETEEQAAREVERVPRDDPAEARDLRREQEHEIVVAKTDAGIEGEARREIAARHQRDGRQVLVIFKKEQAAADGGENVGEREERGDLSPRGRDEGAADFRPRERPGEG